MKFDLEILKRKLSSRKFWAAVIGFSVAIATAFGCKELSQESVALIVSGCAAIGAYIIGEGIADSSNRKSDG